MKAGGFLTGTPADIIEQLKAVEKRYPGVDRVVCATPLGTPLEVAAGRPGSIRQGGHARLPPGEDRFSGGVRREAEGEYMASVSAPG